MKNIREHYIIYMYFVIIVIIFTGCTQQKVETEATPTEMLAFTPETTPIYTAEPNLELFDDEYTNTISGNQRIIYDGKSIWYTTGSYLYYIDLETQEKQLIETRLIEESIYIYNEEIYYLTSESLNKIKVDTLQISTVISAKGITGKAYRQEINAKNEKFQEFIILNNLLLFRFFATSENHGELSGIVWCEIDELEFYLQTGPTERDISEQIPYIEIERIDTQTVIYGDEGISVLMWNKKDNDASQLIGVATNRYIFGEEMIIKSNEEFTIFTRINDNRVAIYDIEESEILFEIFPPTDTKVIMHTLKQYGIISYYEEDEEGTFINGNVILIDRKNELIYENNEIDCLLEGDIDYTNLILADYYQIGNEVYVMENQYIKNYYYSNDRKERINEDALNTGHMFTEIPVLVNIYKVEIINGKLTFNLLYNEFN